MLVSTDPVALLRAALELSAAAEKYDDFPQLRIGLAVGMRGQPGRRLVRQPGERWPAGSPGWRARTRCWSAESVREAIGAADGFSWSFAGRRATSKASRAKSRLFRARAARLRNSTLTAWRRTSISRRWACSTASKAGRARTRAAADQPGCSTAAFSIDHIRASVAARSMLPAHRVLGDDGELRVGARGLRIDRASSLEAAAADSTQRAIGLPQDRWIPTRPSCCADGARPPSGVARRCFTGPGHTSPTSRFAVMRVVDGEPGVTPPRCDAREAASKTTCCEPGASERSELARGLGGSWHVRGRPRCSGR